MDISIALTTLGTTEIYLNIFSNHDANHKAWFVGIEYRDPSWYCTRKFLIILQISPEATMLLKSLVRNELARQMHTVRYITFLSKACNVL